MSSAEVDAYLAGLDEVKRETLERLRADILAVLPDAEQGLSYGAPAFRVRGALVAGFVASSKHLSYLPHSGTVLTDLDPHALEHYSWSKGALRFPVDEPLPATLVATLIRARQAELA